MKIFCFSVLLGLLFFSCTKSGDNIKLDPVNVNDAGQGKNIIFLIGDGMGLGQITAARTVNGGDLNIFRCGITGIQSTHSADKYVTDSGASATAMSCGQKTNNYTLGIDINGNPLETILELAEKNGLSTGLITTSEIVHATPAAFYAHQTNRYQYEDIALELIGKGVDFFMGGGKKYFSQRTDSLSLIDSLVLKGYEVTDNLNLSGTSKMSAVFIAEDIPLKYLEGRGEVLSEAVWIAVNRLKNNEKGFFIMVEGAQIDWAGEENDQAYLMAEMLDFDRAVGKAMDFAEVDGNTLVVVTGDHETAGFALLDGDITNNTVQGGFMTWLHTGMMVPVFAYGPGAEEFIGVYENTAFYYKFLKFYGF
jgi:alkaline phosphatase